MPGLVTVACNVSIGIVMEAPGKESKIIRGPAVKYGEIPAFVISGGYALTPNVDADLYDAWMVANKSSDMVQNHCIFAHAKTSDASAQAKEMIDEKSGLEPLDPAKPGKGLEPVGA